MAGEIPRQRSANEGGAREREHPMVQYGADGTQSSGDGIWDWRPDHIRPHPCGGAAMSRRAAPNQLSEEMREHLKRELVEADLAAELRIQDRYVAVSKAFDAGLTVDEIKTIFGIGAATVVRWRDWGEQERNRRSSGSAERSGERAPES